MGQMLKISHQWWLIGLQQRREFTRHVEIMKMKNRQRQIDTRQRLQEAVLSIQISKLTKIVFQRTAEVQLKREDQQLKKEVNMGCSILDTFQQ